MSIKLRAVTIIDLTLTDQQAMELFGTTDGASIAKAMSGKFGAREVREIGREYPGVVEAVRARVAPR